MSAKVDSACVQDTFTLYHHTMVVSAEGDWCVVQQGMSDSSARRYHWLSHEVDDLVCEPQAAIASQAAPGSVLDLTASRAAETRAVSVDLVNDDPSNLKRYLTPTSQRSLADFGVDPDPTPRRPDLRMPDQHELRPSDLSVRAIDQLRRAYEVQPADFEELVGVESIGRGSLRALGLIAELVYDAERSHEDPAKYAYAHGGKDGTPDPVHRERYDRSIEFLQATLSRADLEDKAKRAALARLAEAG